MKVKSAIFSELHGSLKKPFCKDLATARCKGPGQIILEKRPIPTGPPSPLQLENQQLLKDLARHWNFLDAGLRSQYQDIATRDKITLYNAFLKSTWAEDVLALDPVWDAYVYVTYPDQNFGTGNEIAMERFDTYEKQVLLRYEETEYEGGPYPLLAEVLCWFNDNHWYPAVGKRVDCYPISGFWLENTVTWNNKPSLYPMASYINLPPMNNFFCCNVTEHIKKFIDGQVEDYGFLLKFHETVNYQGGTVWMDAREATGAKILCQLRLYYA